MYDRYYMTRLWSEPNKSGKTFLAAVISLWEALVNPEAEIVCCANDQEQAVSRVFQTCWQLIKYNSETESSGLRAMTFALFVQGNTSCAHFKSAAAAGEDDDNISAFAGPIGTLSAEMPRLLSGARGSNFFHNRFPPKK